MSSLYKVLSQEKFEDIASRILYEDNHILSFNKKAGEIVQGDKTGDEPLCDMMKSFIAIRDNKPGRVFMGVIHRLDRPVSGIVIFAKTSKALERMNEMFRKGEVQKIYWALTENPPSPSSAEIRTFLTRNEKQNKSYSHPAEVAGSKEAILRYKTIRATKNYFIVEIELITGRHHQIRCQLASIGCPIKGDLKYGAKRSNRDGGISLHAKEIRFIHPVRKEEIRISAPTEMEEM